MFVIEIANRIYLESLNVAAGHALGTPRMADALSFRTQAEAAAFLGKHGFCTTARVVAKTEQATKPQSFETR